MPSITDRHRQMDGDDGSAPLMKESDRRLYLFAMENIIAELFHPAPCVLFRDHTGWIGICRWGVADSNIAADAERLIQKYLKLAVNVHLEPVSEEADGAVARPMRLAGKGCSRRRALRWYGGLVSSSRNSMPFGS